ncbi:hypothetical protein [Pseudomonas phage Persinger]|uniref:SprT-like domain-containing protein n=1 Tax=Pseudomonas phage Persinger TaxID=2749430 RepID=A0A7D7EYQ5_9CAUD|nr:hypothetical protein KB682_gp39 [Pseudomonas phage Persinger]QMP19191.1 hypothetical protein [Pseudomonas phage Persinger]
MNRETWLNLLADKMAPRFAEMGFPLPKFRVSVGFGAAGQRSRTAAEVWNAACSEDGTFEILIMPDQVDADLVACHLAHELTHTAVGFEQGHKGDFARVALALGMNRPMTATTPGPAFKEWVAPFLAELGPMPHAKLRFDRGLGESAPAAPKSGSQDQPEGAAPAARTPRRAGESTRPPKQTTRLKKAECSQCGYTVRVTSKWLEVGPPHCPKHGAMDCDVDLPDGGDDE